MDKIHTKFNRGTGVMAQKLRALIVLPEDQVQLLASMQRLTTICYSSFRGSDALFWPLQVPVPHMAYKHACK